MLDTETTGLDAFQGDRVVEIGCVELIDRFPTGHTFHAYINPERDMPEGAFAVHGLSAEFLKDKPVFAEIADDFLGFIGAATLVIHNAVFDINFLNAELERIGKPPIGRERVTDTLLVARRKHPAGPNKLDDLCTRYGIDNSRRAKHGALLDAEILAEVYVELIGARQAQLGLAAAGAKTPDLAMSGGPASQRPGPLPDRLTRDDMAAHDAFIAMLGPQPLWRDYLSAGASDGAPEDTAGDQLG